MSPAISTSPTKAKRRYIPLLHRLLQSFPHFERQSQRGDEQSGTTARDQCCDVGSAASEGIPEINGKATLKKVGEKPPVWEGTLERKNGKHFKMKVEFR